MLSKEEWRATSERAAAAKYGEKHATWLRFRRFGLGPAGILVAVAALGLGAWWMFAHVAKPLVSGAGPVFVGHLPLAFWFVVAVSLLATIYVFRSRIIPIAPSLRFLRAVVFGMLWLGLLTYAVTVLAA